MRLAWALPVLDDGAGAPPGAGVCAQPGTRPDESTSSCHGGGEAREVAEFGREGGGGGEVDAAHRRRAPRRAALQAASRGRNGLDVNSPRWPRAGRRTRKRSVEVLDAVPRGRRAPRSHSPSIQSMCVFVHRVFPARYTLPWRSRNPQSRCLAARWAALSCPLARATGRAPPRPPRSAPAPPRATRRGAGAPARATSRRSVFTRAPLARGIRTTAPPSTQSRPASCQHPATGRTRRARPR